MAFQADEAPARYNRLGKPKRIAGLKRAESQPSRLGAEPRDKAPRAKGKVDEVLAELQVDDAEVGDEEPEQAQAAVDEAEDDGEGADHLRGQVPKAEQESGAGEHHVQDVVRPV